MAVIHFNQLKKETSTSFHIKPDTADLFSLTAENILAS